MQSPAERGLVCRLLCLLFVLMLAKLDTAAACSIQAERPDMKQLYARAPTVLIGHLLSVEEAGVVSTGEQLPRQVAVEGTLRIVEVFKGRAPPDGKIRAPAFEACGPILWVGHYYLFFLDEGGFVRTWQEALPLHRWPPSEPTELRRQHLLDGLGIGRNEQK